MLDCCRIGWGTVTTRHGGDRPISRPVWASAGDRRR
ncbi:hypothetical protein [Nocardia testacea]|uniref:Uncharacterized protein n=1 Tax=Nocardia testacea TaxID=248551 RepID=A0ABW7VWJ9_9NOCA